MKQADNIGENMTKPTQLSLSQTFQITDPRAPLQGALTTFPRYITGSRIIWILQPLVSTVRLEGI